MFKLFKRKENTVLGFLKNKDIEVANAYRTNSVLNIRNGFNSKAMEQLRNDVAAHSMEFGFNGQQDTDKYVDEKLVDRFYEVISESEDEVVVKRDVKFKRVKEFNILMQIADDFSEIFTINKTNGNYMITNIAFA